MKLKLFNNDYIEIYDGEFEGTADVVYGKMVKNSNGERVKTIESEFRHDSLAELLKLFGYALDDYEEDISHYLYTEGLFIQVVLDKKFKSNKYSLCDIETEKEISSSYSLAGLLIDELSKNKSNNI